MSRRGWVEIVRLIAGCCLAAVAVPAPARGADHLLLTEICVTLTPAEFIEIYNPTGSAIDLTDYYLSDGIYQLDQDYINLVDCTYSYYNLDFLARFPDGEIIAPGEALWIAVNGDTATSYYGLTPDYELFADVVPDAIPNMLDPGIEDCQTTAWIGDGGASGALLSNGAEVMILFYWDGVSDLVEDVDIVQWGDLSAQINVCKTGFAKDGPDPDLDPTPYLDDTPVEEQDYVASSAHIAGNSWQRVDVDEGSEVLVGGNGITGHDETSEDLSATWEEAPATPGLFSLGAPTLHSLYVGGEEDSFHLTDHTPLISWTYEDPGLVPQAFYEVEVGTDDEWSVAEMWNPDSVASSDTFAVYGGDPLEDGETYYARARASNGSEWSGWAETSFRMNSVPGAPAVISPPDGGETDDPTPLLVISNGVDPEGDPLTYTFEVYSDSALTGLVDSATGIPEGVDSTSWEVSVSLTLGEECWWRARAHDGFEPGVWMEAASFTVTQPGVWEEPAERETRTIFFLAQNLPNPMQSAATVRYGVPGDPMGGSGERAGRRHVTLSIYNLNGQLVRRLVDRPEAPGVKQVTWDGCDGSGSSVASGVYFCRLTVEERSAVRRLVVLR